MQSRGKERVYDCLLGRGKAKGFKEGTSMLHASRVEGKRGNGRARAGAVAR